MSSNVLFCLNKKSKDIQLTMISDKEKQPDPHIWGNRCPKHEMNTALHSKPLSTVDLFKQTQRLVKLQPSVYQDGHCNIHTDATLV